MLSRIVSMKLLSSSLIIFVVLADFLISTTSPLSISISIPSRSTYADVLFLNSVILILTTLSLERTMLLLITVWGAIGVKVNISAVGSTIGPPHERL